MQVRNEDLRWRVGLAQKADIIQDKIAERHLVEGTYVPHVPVPADGGPIDHTTTGNTGDMHAVCWTGCYLMGNSFRLGWASERGTADDEKEALRLGGLLVGGLNILSHVTGTPGLLVRKIVYGHGPGPEERQGRNERNEWHQGVGDYRDFRFRGHPSHHNYHHALRGLGYWYYFLTVCDLDHREVVEQKAEVKGIIADLMNYAYRENTGTLYTVDGRRSATLFRDESRLTTGGIMATNCLKLASAILREEFYEELYQKWVERYRYREIAAGVESGDSKMPESLTGADCDDTEHLLGSLWLVRQFEKEESLRNFYTMAAEALFSRKRHLKRSLFNFLYADITGNEEGADLQGALETLKLYPTVTLTYPIMNSIRDDIEIEYDRHGRKETKELLPFNEIPLDNAYDWKGDPYRADRWLSRKVVSVAVSDEDPMVWFVCDDQGDLYQSLDGGRGFQTADFYHRARVNDVTFGARKNRVAVLAADTGIYWTQTGGYQNTWQPAGSEVAGKAARRVFAEPGREDVIWAELEDGIYRSIDLGKEEVGKVWEKVSSPIPGEKKVVFGLSPAPEPVIYAAIAGRVYRQHPDERDWTEVLDTEGYHILPETLQIMVHPDRSHTAYILQNLEVWGREIRVLLRTTDGGETFGVVGQEFERAELPSSGSGLEEVELTSIAVDRRDPDLIYGASLHGFYRSEDRGITWSEANDGLRIPRVYHVFTPVQIPDRMYASTPAGFHISRDQGLTWSDPLLVLNGPGVDRIDRGGFGYLVAYWPGRYFGCIQD